MQSRRLGAAGQAPACLAQLLVRSSAPIRRRRSWARKCGASCSAISSGVYGLSAERQLDRVANHPARAAEHLAQHLGRDRAAARTTARRRSRSPSGCRAGCASRPDAGRASSARSGRGRCAAPGTCARRASPMRPLPKSGMRWVSASSSIGTRCSARARPSCWRASSTPRTASHSASQPSSASASDSACSSATCAAARLGAASWRP